MNTLGDPKKLHKYKIYGGYHWKWYETRLTYRRHAEFLKSWVKEKNTLDIGAGDGKITSLLGIKGVDNDPDGIKAAARRGVEIDLGDAYNLPYSDEQFDSCLMSDTIEHFSNPNRALKEARRVIRKYLYINIPANESFDEPDHYSAWTPDEFIAQVTKCGFKHIEGPRVKHFKRRYYFKFEKTNL